MDDWNHVLATFLLLMSLKLLTTAVDSAGVETITSTLRCFILAMTLYPEVQHKAHEEVMRVVGPVRLPSATE